MIHALGGDRLPRREKLLPRSPHGWTAHPPASGTAGSGRTRWGASLQEGIFIGASEATDPLSVESFVHLHEHHEDIHFLGGC